MNIHIAVSGYIKNDYAVVHSYKYKYSLIWLDDTDQLSILKILSFVLKKYRRYCKSSAAIQ